MQNLYIGVDVGSGSVRAGLFDTKGNKLAQAVSPIKQFRPAPDFIEQSSSDIWKQTCKVVSAAVKEAEINPAQVKGIGFDATCSLVALDSSDQPVSVRQLRLMTRTSSCGWIIALWLKPLKSTTPTVKF